MKRAIVFIDGNNWYHNSKIALEGLGDIDFRKLAKLICFGFGLELVYVKYYNSVPSENSKSFWKHKKFIDILRKDGLIVKTKELGRDCVSCSVIEGYSKELRTEKNRFKIIKRDDLIRCLK
ncbi:MAG: hypothetical protein V1889_02050 [archaeon]